MPHAKQDAWWWLTLSRTTDVNLHTLNSIHINLLTPKPIYVDQINSITLKFKIERFDCKCVFIEYKFILNIDSFHVLVQNPGITFCKQKLLYKLHYVMALGVRKGGSVTLRCKSGGGGEKEEGVWLW